MGNCSLYQFFSIEEGRGSFQAEACDAVSRQAGKRCHIVFGSCCHSLRPQRLYTCGGRTTGLSAQWSALHTTASARVCASRLACLVWNETCDVSCAGIKLPDREFASKATSGTLTRTHRALSGPQFPRGWRRARGGTSPQSEKAASNFRRVGSYYVGIRDSDQQWHRLCASGCS